MELTYEKVKSIILAVLVVLSVILTWNLWSYHPNVEEFENRNTIQEVAFSPKKDMKEIVKIDQTIFHMDSKYFGTVSSEKMDKMMSVIKNWKFTDFDNIPFAQIDVASIVEDRDNVQILYPGEISSELFASIYQIEGKNLPQFSFNQILIDFRISEGEHGTVYFISQEDKQVYSSHVLASSINHFKNEFMEEEKQYDQFFSLTTGTGQKIYLPENETELVNNQYLTKTNVEADQLMNALFSNPSLVQKNFISTGVEYKDGQNLMRENNETHMITYIDPSEAENENKETNEDLLKQSIDFVNNHGGWTDNYRFVRFDKAKRTLHFQIYGPDGYPVFGENSPISNMEIEWSSAGISRYYRNNFSLGLLTLKSVKTIESGHAALEKIQQRENYNPDLLEDIKIGYKMKMNVQTLLLSLEPSWFYLYDGEWYPLASNEIGGEQIGLE